MSNAPAAVAAASVKLSELIYVELLGRAFLRVENAAAIKPEPEVLAKLSMELAEAFRKVEKAAAAAAGPKNVGYDVQSMDFDALHKHK